MCDKYLQMVATILWLMNKLSTLALILEEYKAYSDGLPQRLKPGVSEQP